MLRKGVERCPSSESQVLGASRRDQLCAVHDGTRPQFSRAGAAAAHPCRVHRRLGDPRSETGACASGGIMRMISSIRAWLNDLGVGQYADAFADNHIDLELLSNLTDAVLKDIGVGSAGHRLSILNA